MNATKIIKELQFKAARSSGAGGQHVNKVSSKITLSFNLQESAALSNKEKEQLFKSLATKLSKEYILQLHCEESRSQHQNKALVVQRFLKIITAGLVIPKKRKATKPSKSSIKKRLEKKKKQAFKKVARKRPEI